MASFCFRRNILQKSLPVHHRHLQPFLSRTISLQPTIIPRPFLISNYLSSRLKSWDNTSYSRSRHSPTRARPLHCSAALQHGGIQRPTPGTGIKLHFKDSKGNLLKTVEANEGDDILAIAHEYDIDLEGACEASIACSTCHVILPPEYFDKLPEPSDDENDMLDMAFGLTDTSRLGCQVLLTKELDGITATLPSATRNMFVDGKKPTKH